MDLQFFAEEKRFPATAKRRREARQKGQVARSGDLSAAALMLGLVAVLQWWAPAAASRMAGFAIRLWGTPLPEGWERGGARALLVDAISVGEGVVMPLLLAGTGIALAVGLAQSGLGFSLTALAPQWSRVNPISGLTRLFSARAAAEGVKSLLKMVLLGALTYQAVGQALAGMPLWLQGGMGSTVVHVLQLTVGLLWKLGLAFLAVAAADYAYQRASHEKALRMTRQELREEMRESEGDPQLRARIRRRQREIARRRMLAEVCRADVVVTNPTHFAVALRYRPGVEDAPVVVARGQGYLALRIRELARRHGVTIMEDPPLARALYAGAKVGQPIPIALYQAVAQVLAYVWRLKGRVA